MILGAFYWANTPYVLAALQIPGTHLRGEGEVHFLLDTGAGRTCLHPRDAQRLGIPIFDLTPSASLTGIGGSAEYAEVYAHVHFADQRRWPWQEPRWLTYRIQLLIALPRRDNWETPSLLGKDIIDRWNIHHDPERNKLECRAHSADWIINA